MKRNPRVRTKYCNIRNIIKFKIIFKTGIPDSNKKRTFVRKNKPVSLKNLVSLRRKQFIHNMIRKKVKYFIKILNQF